MKNKVVIYTAIFGGYDELLEPEFIPEGCDFVCFTDSTHFKSDVWDIRVVTPYYEQPVRNSRYYKTKPHIFFPDYEISLWIDGTIVVKNDIHYLIEDHLSNSNMACFNHNWTVLDPHDCAYFSAQYILQLGEKNYKKNPELGLKTYKDDPALIIPQMEKYRQEGFPEHFGHVISGIMFRRHNEQDCINVMKTWWEEIKYHSHLCQLSLGYSFWKNDFKWDWLPGDIRSFPDIVHQGPHTSKLVTANIVGESKKGLSLVDNINDLNKIESNISKEEFAILGSGLLALMGIQENKNFDIIISSTVRHKLFDGNRDSIKLDGVNILKSNSIKKFSSHGDDDLIRNYTFKVNDYNFLEPRFHFKEDDKNLKHFLLTEGNKKYPFNQLSKDKWCV